MLPQVEERDSRGNQRGRPGGSGPQTLNHHLRAYDPVRQRVRPPGTFEVAAPKGQMASVPGPKQEIRRGLEMPPVRAIIEGGLIKRKEGWRLVLFEIAWPGEGDIHWKSGRSQGQRRDPDETKMDTEKKTLHHRSMSLVGQKGGRSNARRALGVLRAQRNSMGESVNSEKVRCPEEKKKAERRGA